MADEKKPGDQKSIDEEDRRKVLQLDQEMRDMPREVRNVISPVRLTGKDAMRFRCYPGISCFNRCCHNVEIVLTPYDLHRLRRRLNITADELLFNYATPHFLTKGQLPVALIRMDEKTGRCPFNTDAGCSVYSDRPVTCRYYPLGMALMRKEEKTSGEEFYFLIKEDFCQGHQEEKEWTVNEWRKDQGSDGYDDMNADWMEFVVKRRSAGDMVQTSLPVSEMFYAASTNPPEFRRFLFDSTFMQRYQVDEETQKVIQEDDLALMEFAFRWLKSVLFGDIFIPPTKEALEDFQRRNKEIKEKMARQSKEAAAQATAAEEAAAIQAEQEADAAAASKAKSESQK